MSIKTGSKPFEFGGNERVKIMAESRVSVFTVNESGELDKFIASGNNTLVFNTQRPFKGAVVVPEGEHWSIEVKERPSPFDKADPVPVEVPEELQGAVTLEDKLKAFVAEMVAERFGKQSDMYETIEEAMDFTMDDEGVPLSGYEVVEMEAIEPESGPGQPDAPGPGAAEASTPQVEVEPPTTPATS